MFYENNPRSELVLESLVESHTARREMLIRFEQTFNDTGRQVDATAETILNALKNWHLSEWKTLVADAAEFDNLCILKGFHEPYDLR